MARFAVVGSGAWGTALAAHLARLEHEVMLWAFERDVAEEICSAHINSAFLPGLALPQTIGASHDMAAAVSGAEIVILVPPSTHLRAVSSVLAPVLPRDAIVTIATKGIEEESLRLMSQVVAETMPEIGPERLAFLSGPTFAREVAQGLPTDAVVASTDRNVPVRVSIVSDVPTTDAIVPYISCSLTAGCGAGTAANAPAGPSPKIATVL